MTRKLIFCTNLRRMGDKPSCAARGSKSLVAHATRRVATEQIDVEIDESVCLGRCEAGPTVKEIPGGFTQYATLELVDQLLNNLAGKVGN
ncbi:MAG: (2Fe-2S) ferredoxin domain-containing protein [Pseudomonadales bacterium]|nr:(2Fe-2S) ferredoxin domain-containing protein [Pseudomonadales bacterium]